MSIEDNKLEISYVPQDTDSEKDQNVKKKIAEKKEHQKKKSLTKKLTSKLKIQEKIIEKLTKERDDFKDKFLRNLAEIDNFRKRIKKENEDYKKYALSDFLKELLVITDNLERALKVKEGESSEKSIISGVEMIYKQFMEILSKNGVTEIEAISKPFDPNIHQALSKEEADSISEPIIVEVYQKGFMYNKKLLRPTLAKVAIPHKPKISESEQDN